MSKNDFVEGKHEIMHINRTVVQRKKRKKMSDGHFLKR